MTCHVENRASVSLAMDHTVVKAFVMTSMGQVHPSVRGVVGVLKDVES